MTHYVTVLLTHEHFEDLIDVRSGSEERHLIARHVIFKHVAAGTQQLLGEFHADIQCVSERVLVPGVDTGNASNELNVQKNNRTTHISPGYIAKQCLMHETGKQLTARSTRVGLEVDPISDVPC